MASERLTLGRINAMSAAEAEAHLGAVFEHSPWIAVEAVARRPFASLEALHEAMMAAVREAPLERRLALLRAHPELAGAAARAKTMTEASNREQAGVGLQQLDEEAQATFDRLNADYRARFGFPFIIAVRGQTFEGLLDRFRQRLENSTEDEIDEALAQIGKITRFRLEDLLAEP